MSAASAQVGAPSTPTYEQLKSFGEPAPGVYPIAGLLRGRDGALYGAAHGGGTIGYGTVFRLNTDGTGFIVLKNLDYSNTGASPYGALIQGADGTLYGTTLRGGSAGFGTVFKLNPDGSGFGVLKNFDAVTTGGGLQAGLIQGRDGALYGTASDGGSYGDGTLFKLNPDGSGFSVLRNFDSPTTGGNPEAELVQGSDGTLYGTAPRGGSSGGYGTVFSLKPDGSDFTVLKSLDSTSTGGHPRGGLLQGADGALYGTAQVGGNWGWGTVFKLDPDGSHFLVLENFDFSTTGGNPSAALLQGMDGALYGTAASGGNGAGGVFKLNPDGTGFSLLKNLDASTSGSNPNAALIQGPDGRLYSTAATGGSSGYGTVFKLNPDGTSFLVLKTLSGSTTREGGAVPNAGLIQGRDGAFYGTAIAGGNRDYGTVFKLNPNGTGFTVLKNLDHRTVGGYPRAGLIQGADGTLFGTAYQGGSNGSNHYGTVFKLNPDGTGFTILKDFYPAIGAYLSAGLGQGADGALYGTTEIGGSGDGGTVFKLNPDGTDFTVLKNFVDNSPTGGFLVAGLIQGADGALYGTAQNGGSGANGTVFKLKTDGTGFSILKNFDYSTTGGRPRAKLLQTMDGALYGTASVGGSSGGGTLFKLNPDGTGFIVLKHFDYSTAGGVPTAELIQGTNGRLYGTATQGGSRGDGTLFELNPDGTGFTVLLNFNRYTTGAHPSAGLVQGTDGNLYGTTLQGGTTNEGTVFRLVFSTPPIANAGSDFSVNEGELVTLDGSLSTHPGGGTLTFAWAQVGGPLVSLSGGATAMPEFTAPTVALGGETLSFDLTVTVNGMSSTDTVSVTVVNVNHPPVAEAGLDQSTAEGSPVTLHGENSFDIDSDPFTYAWVQVENGSPAVSLAGANTATPGFTAPYVGTSGAPGVVAALVFELRVDDGYPQDQPAPGFTFANVVDRVTVEITNVNNDPTSRAGADQTVDENASVTLNGSASSDPDSDELGYAWTQVGGPNVILSGAATASPNFTAPLVSAGGADVELELTVDDGYGGVATDRVVIHVQNTNDPPLASAAQPTTSLLWPPNHGLVAVGIMGVSDPNGDSVTITITSVTQDEPTNGLGDGDTAIDAVINADGTVLLRAERSGTGDGRVYRIHFTATDFEGSASGVVLVTVPHSVKKPAIDGGGVFDSTH